LYQAQSTECGVASLAIVLAHFGRSVPMEELRDATGVSRDGTTAAGLVRAARQYGLDARAVRAEPDRLAGLGLPLIAHLDFIHFLVVEGIGKRCVRVNDPEVGRHEIPSEKFAERFTGIVLVFQPTEAFQPQRGRRRPGLSLWADASGSRPWLTAAVAAGTLTTLPTVWFALSLARLTDRPPSGANVILLLAGLAAAALARLVVAWVLEVCLKRIETSVSSSTPELLRHLLDLPFRFFTYRLPMDLHALALSKDEQGRLMGGRGAAAMAACLGAPVLLAAQFVFDTRLGAATAAIAGGYAAVAALLQRRAAGERRHADSFLRDEEADVAALLRRVEMHRTGGREQDFFSALAGREALIVSAQRPWSTAQAMVAVAGRAAEGLLTLLVVLAAVRLGVGSLVAIHLVGMSLLALLRELLSQRGTLDRLERSAQLIEDVSGIQGEPNAPAGDSERLRGTLAIRSVSFGYARQRPPLLRDISFEVPPGAQIGIAGGSGSGKSALAALLAGLHRPWSGMVEFCGRPLESIPRAVLARSIAWVPKEPLLFEGTVRDNLRLWNDAVSEEDLAGAVRDACLDGVLAGRPGGLSARVTSRGVNFSGGQRQRLEIARALARNPSVLIFDEANAAIETDLEETIRANIRRRGCSLVIVTQRDTTLRACDEVRHLENGSLVAAPGRREDRPSEAAHTTPAEAVAQPGHSPALALAFRIVAEAAGMERWQGACRASAGSGAENPAPHPADTAATWLAPCSGSMAADNVEAGVLELARPCGVPVRRVRLVSHAWWRQDHGPLLAFLDSRPVALLPRGRGYRVAENGRGRRLGASEACRIAPDAFALYPPDSGARCGSEVLREAVRRRRGELCQAGFSAAGLAAAATAPLLAACTLLAGQAQPGPLAAVLLAALAAGVLLDVARAAALQRVEARTEESMMAALYARLVRLPARVFRQHAAEDVARWVQALRHAREQAGAEHLTALLAAPVLASSLFVLAWISLPVAAWAAAAAVLLALAPVATARAELALETTRSPLDTAHRRFLLDALRGIAQLRMMDAERGAAAQWERDWSAERRIAFRQRGLAAATAALREGGPLGALVLFGVAIVHAGTGAAGLFACYLACAQSAAGAAALGNGLAAFVRARFWLGRMDRMLGEPAEPVRTGDTSTRFSGAVQLRDVAFRYEDAEAPALRGVSLTVRPGEIVAVAGPSGSGKSTLLRVIAGLEMPERGVALYDGRPFHAWDAAALRAQVGAVLQEDQLSTATARYNIGGLCGYPLEDVWEAARLAGVDGDIRRMPMGIQTILDDDRVSTGQKQRLLIAGCLVRRPRLLLLDEAVSALGEAVQREVLAHVRALGITCVCVTHRPSTIALADRACVLNEGQVEWCGPAADWLAHKGWAVPPQDEAGPAPLPAASRLGGETAGVGAPRATEQRLFRRAALDRFYGPFITQEPATVATPLRTALFAGSALLLAAGWLAARALGWRL
jgi:ABC-type bacteriocin/lantibiotic exporter with double-glycine peptidase domain